MKLFIENAQENQVTVVTVCLKPKRMVRADDVAHSLDSLKFLDTHQKVYNRYDIYITCTDEWQTNTFARQMLSTNILEHDTVSNCPSNRCNSVIVPQYNCYPRTLMSLDKFKPKKCNELVSWILASAMLMEDNIRLQNSFFFEVLPLTRHFLSQLIRDRM